MESQVSHKILCYIVISITPQCLQSACCVCSVFGEFCVICVLCVCKVLVTCVCLCDSVSVLCVGVLDLGIGEARQARANFFETTPSLRPTTPTFEIDSSSLHP